MKNLTFFLKAITAIMVSAPRYLKTFEQVSMRHNEDRPRSFNRLIRRTIVFGLLAPSLAFPIKLPRSPVRQQFWIQYEKPEQAGFDSVRLEAVCAFANDIKSGAIMVVYRGRVVAAWGAVDRNFMAHSVRKSLAGALYGIASAEHRLNLDATLAEIGIDDEPTLTSGEKQAHVRDLLAARSGVYHTAAYADERQDNKRPPRGSQSPGTFWFYNNWDFNAAETIFERATGEDLYEAFDSRIARPIGMEDFSPANGFDVLEPGQSLIPAHTLRISARDLARFGVLYLQNGLWDGKQIVPRDWIRESLTPHSDLGNGSGYGYLWWTYAPGALGNKCPLANRLTIYEAEGTGGQALFLLPAEDLVVVHRADTDNNRSVGDAQVWSLLEQILASRTGKPSSSLEFRAMETVVFSSQLPEPPTPAFLPLDSASMIRYVGEYDISGGASGRVFVYENKLFIDVPHRGVAELFAISRTDFTIRVIPGVRIVFTEETGGAVTDVTLVLGPQRIEAHKRDSTSARLFDVSEIRTGIDFFKAKDEERMESYCDV